MGRKWEVRYVTYSSMVPFVSVALSEWGLGDLGPEPSREMSAVCNPNVTRDGLAHQYTTRVGNGLRPLSPSPARMPGTLLASGYLLTSVMGPDGGAQGGASR